MNLPTQASGCYHYYCNGNASGITESWEITQRGQEYHIDCVRHATPIGVTLRVRSVQSASGFSRCMLHWMHEKAGYSIEVSADYCFDASGVTVFVHDGNEEVELREPGTDFIFSPLMRIYNGTVIKSLVTAGEPTRVLVPWIKVADKTECLLRPEFSQRQAQLLGEDSVRISNQDIPCQQYDYSGGEYQPGTRFWIDENGVMLRYRWLQENSAQWDITLDDYCID